MDLNLVEARARDLLDQHGLVTWQFAWDHARRRAGQTVFGPNKITLSKVLMKLYSPEQVDQVILHEIAHALVGPKHNHDATWRRTAARIGVVRPRASLKNAPSPEPRWIGTCPAGHEVHRFRRPTSVQSCSICNPRFSRAHLITWHMNPARSGR